MQVQVKRPKKRAFEGCCRWYFNIFVHTTAKSIVLITGERRFVLLKSITWFVSKTEPEKPVFSFISISSFFCEVKSRSFLITSLADDNLEKFPTPLKPKDLVPRGRAFSRLFSNTSWPNQLNKRMKFSFFLFVANMMRVLGDRPSRGSGKEEMSMCQVENKQRKSIRGVVM